MKKLTILLGLLVSTYGPPALAHDNAEELQALNLKIQALSQRLDALDQSGQKKAQDPDQVPVTTMAWVDEVIEDKVGEAVSVQVNERMAAVSWAERMRWAGELRYRFEDIEVDGTNSRTRSRIQARAKLQAGVSENMQLGLGLASGDDNPRTANQTLGGGGSTKDLRLDLAYFDWSGPAGTRILGGKFENFLVRPGKNGLLWDGDWRPEGIGANWNNSTFFANALGTWLESDSSNGDELAWVAQAGMNFNSGGSTHSRIGLSYAQFDTAGSGSFFGDDDDFFGNSFDPDTLSYLHDYHMIEAFAELTIDLADRPLMLFADYVTNTAVNVNDSGYALGFQYGKASGRGTWDIAYVYENLEADAAYGQLTDSDIGGGGSDVKGSIFKGTWAFHENWNARIIYFLNEFDMASGNPRDLDRVRIDLNFKYK